MIVAYTHDKASPASSFVTDKPEFTSLVFGLIVCIIHHGFTFFRNCQELLTILMCFTRWIVQKFKITLRRFKSTLHTKPPFLAVCLRVKSISCQDSASSKNRLFFASGRILVGIGRAHSWSSGLCIANRLQPSRIVSFLLRAYSLDRLNRNLRLDICLRAWISHRNHNQVKISDRHTKRARHAPTCQLWTRARAIDARACRLDLAEIAPPPVHLVQKTIQTLQNTIQWSNLQTWQTWPRRIVSGKNVKQIAPC